MLLSYPDVRISAEASEETFEFFVDQAEKNNTLVKKQLDAVPSAMSLTIDTQFQNNLFREEAATLRLSMDMHEPPRFDQERFKNLLLKMLEKKD
jgi:hypothetical protein